MTTQSVTDPNTPIGEILKAAGSEGANRATHSSAFDSCLSPSAACKPGRNAAPRLVIEGGRVPPCRFEPPIPIDRDVPRRWRGHLITQVHETCRGSRHSKSPLLSSGTAWGQSGGNRGGTPHGWHGPCSRCGPRRRASSSRWPAWPAARWNRRPKRATVSSHESALTRSRRRIEAGAAGITTACPGPQLPPRPIQQLQLGLQRHRQEAPVAGPMGTWQGRTRTRDPSRMPQRPVRLPGAASSLDGGQGRRQRLRPLIQLDRAEPAVAARRSFGGS